MDGEAHDGQAFDLVIDVRPSAARAKNPYPAPCLAIFADDLLDPAELAAFAVAYPPGCATVCACCWSGMRAARVAYHLRALGWDAYWWALSPLARAIRE